jgi:Ty3 transposon capsid-like protein
MSRSRNSQGRYVSHGAENLNSQSAPELQELSPEIETLLQPINNINTNLLKALQVNIPQYNGRGQPEGLRHFFRRCEAYFEIANMNDYEKIIMISAYLTDTAGIWFDTISRQSKNMTYNNFKILMVKQFTSEQNELNTLSRLKSLKQGKRRVIELADKLESLYLQLSSYNEKDKIVQFVDNLRYEIQYLIKSRNWKNDTYKELRESAISIEEQLYFKNNFLQREDKVIYNNSNNDTSEIKSNGHKIFYAKNNKIDRSNYKCEICFQNGHSKRYCDEVNKFIATKLKTTGNSNCLKTSEATRQGNTRREAMCILHASTNSDHEIIFDSGCTEHIIKNSNWLSDAKEYKTKIMTAGNTWLETTHIGTLNCKINNLNVSLKNVLAAPEIKNSLFSIRTCTTYGISVLFKENYVKLFRDKEELLTVYLNENQYVGFIKPKIIKSFA